MMEESSVVKKLIAVVRRPPEPEASTVLAAIEDVAMENPQGRLRFPKFMRNTVFPLELDSISVGTLAF
ncbi:hypothetical protein [Rhodococcus qingshengii]|uniref:hypothetical protein n=1 Tax=Rhodococcus qingshengii TaxID=334542 RepID=UPI0035E37D65